MVYICLHLSNFEGLDVGKHIIHWAGISFLHVVFHLTESRRSEVSTLNVYLIGVKDSKWILFFAILCNQIQSVYCIYIYTYLFVGNRLIICKSSTCWYLFTPYHHHSVIISPYKSKGLFQHGQVWPGPMFQQDFVCHGVVAKRDTMNFLWIYPSKTFSDQKIYCESHGNQLAIIIHQVSLGPQKVVDL